MKAKLDRNKRLYEFHLKHPKMSVSAVARMFHLTQPRAWVILKREKSKIEV